MLFISYFIIYSNSRPSDCKAFLSQVKIDLLYCKAKALEVPFYDYIQWVKNEFDSCM